MDATKIPLRRRMRRGRPQDGAAVNLNGRWGGTGQI
jgi:hypothetical protein